MIKVCVILTCFNRKELTKRCIDTLYDARYDMQYVIADDGSTDGTGQMLEAEKKEYSIHILNGTGGWYWCGGMREGISYASKNIAAEYYLLINDDVFVFENALHETINQSVLHDNGVIVGAVCSSDGKLSYGGVLYSGKGIGYQTVSPGAKEPCHTFNANFVLIPQKIFLKAGNIDCHFTHSMGDFAYGLQINKMGYSIYTSQNYVGICEPNVMKGTWQDTSLSRMERIKRKESAKGLPAQEWFFFLKIHFGYRKAIIYSISPYIRILMRK